jgi:hypothetical protein
MCIDGSRYMDQIEQYLRFYPKESFLFLLTDELNRDPPGALRKIWEFLGLDEIELGDAPLVSNEMASQREGKVRLHTTAPFRKVPGLYRVAGMVPQSWRDGFYSFLKSTPYGTWMRRRHTAPPMRPETRRRLIREFRPGNERLAEFLGRDLSHWSD